MKRADKRSFRLGLTRATSGITNAGMNSAHVRIARPLTLCPVLLLLACQTPPRPTTCESRSTPAQASASFVPTGPAAAADELRVAPEHGARAELLFALSDASIWQLQLEADRELPARISRSNERLKVQDGWCEVWIDGTQYDGVAERVLNIPRGAKVALRASARGLTATHWVEGNLDAAPYFSWTRGELSPPERNARSMRDLEMAVQHELRVEGPGHFSLPQPLLRRVCAEDLFSQIRVIPSGVAGQSVWTVYGVRRSALVARLGIENGDQLLTLNGADLGLSSVPFDDVGATCGPLSLELKRGDATFKVKLDPR